METHIKKELENTIDGKLAKSILRSCVHCGFCNATCPTYQLLGDENDSPRGRIYLIKQLFEGDGSESTEKTRLHLDRCLTCRSCETTCPSGVKYGALLDIGRKLMEDLAPRSREEKKKRKRLQTTLSSPKRFGTLLRAGQLLRPLLPKDTKKKVPKKRLALEHPTTTHERKMLILQGCVQPALSPDINTATAVVLDKLGISLIHHKKAKCCGAVSQHLSAEDKAITQIKNNIDAWWDDISNGIEAIITTASGCGTMLKDYPHYLREEGEYLYKAEIVASLSKDISEIIIEEDYASLPIKKTHKLSWHSPCTLQHGQKITGYVEKLLTDTGHTLLPVQDGHICCGSAGTYSILQPELSEQLKQNKLENLTREMPDIIVTANIGCQTHLQQGTEIPVIHWINLFV
jgi:glycolate oxidase iron-sulfur subunit